MNVPSKKNKSDQGPRRRAARLAAVQALYEMDVAGVGADSVLLEFERKRWDDALEDEGETEPLSKPNEVLLSHLVKGTAERSNELDIFIKTALSKNLSIDRMEPLLKTILRSATFELTDPESDVSSTIIISEYVDITHAFFSGNETNLVNGILDRLARESRPGEKLKGNG